MKNKKILSMSSFVDNLYHELIQSSSTFRIDSDIRDSIGNIVYRSEDSKWFFNCNKREHYIKWEINNPLVEYSIKLATSLLIMRTSTRHALNFARNVQTLLKQSKSYHRLAYINSIEEQEEVIIICLEEIRISLKQSARLHRFTYLYKWYQIGNLVIKELGFCNEYLQKISAIIIPGNPKGRVVRSEDKQYGRLSDEELKLLIQLLKEDLPRNHHERMERTATALCIYTGRNTTNYTLLRSIDLVIKTNTIHRNYYINFPRVKKRENPYKTQVKMQIPEWVGNLLVELIAESNKPRVEKNTSTYPQLTLITTDNEALFRAEKGSRLKPSININDPSFLTEQQFNRLLKGFVKRKNIISKRTNKLLNITTRRLRYTLASRLVEHGASRSEVAHLLDHSDLQNVHVYFEISAKIASILEKSSRGFINTLIDKLKGDTPKNKVDAENCYSKSSYDNLYPIGCIKCTAFRRYQDIDLIKILQHWESCDEKKK